MAVVPVAVYCRIEWCVSQPQSALAFRSTQCQLAQLCRRANVVMSHSGSSESSFPYRCKIVYHTW